MDNDKIYSIQSLTLRTSGMRFTTEQEIVVKDGKAEISQYGIRYERGEDVRVLEKRAECDADVVLKLCSDCGLLSWDGFNGPHPDDVLDGIMFRLTATVNDGKKIYASGSENFPHRYREFTEGLYRLLNE